MLPSPAAERQALDGLIADYNHLVKSLLITLTMLSVACAEPEAECCACVVETCPYQETLETCLSTLETQPLEALAQDLGGIAPEGSRACLVNDEWIDLDVQTAGCGSACEMVARSGIEP